MYRMLVTFGLAALLCSGCVSFPKTETLATLTPGITAQQLSEAFDGAEPSGVQYIDGHRVIKYQLRNNQYSFFDYYFVFDQNNFLVGWEEAPEQPTESDGVSLFIPIILRK